MILEPRASYLVLHDEQATTRRVAILRDFNDALLGWTPGSRLSPVWRVHLSGEVDGVPPLAGRSNLLFVGPVQPARLSADISKLSVATSIWATLGCFNIVILAPSSSEGLDLCETIVQWARTHEIACEHWSLENDEVISTRQHVLGDSDAARRAVQGMAAFADAHDHPALKAYYQEHLVASATALARSSAVYPAAFEDLAHVAAAMAATMEIFRSGELGILEMQSRLLTMNAALSRFSSQAFSGVPPIHGTECHFWIHSLLGTGSANFALASLVKEVQQVLGNAKLPERLEQLSQIKTDVPSLNELTDSKDLLSFDIIKKTNLKDDAETVIPLVTYFSGRDGFSSHVQTLSAPLTTLAECNSFRSNLLTVTHEIAHILIQSALAVLSPTTNNSLDLDEALKILSPHFQATNYLEAAKQLFLEGVLSMAQAAQPHRDPYSSEEIAQELPIIIDRSRPEVQEILVHTFDFLYFHAGDPNYYISNIWHSWCAIPGIHDRVSDYLMRTLCAVSAILLKEKPAQRFPAALRSVEEVLKEIEPKIGIPDNYVSSALRYIASLNKRPDLYEQAAREYGVRMRLVRLVHIFLFSDILSAELFQDPHIGGGEGYRTKRPLSYDTSPVGNALQFLRAHLKANPSEAESMWVLHCLAFDCIPGPA